MIDTGCEDGIANPIQARWVKPLATLCAKCGIKFLDRSSNAQGIVHVVGLESGFSLPGATVVCGDSHTSTNGAIGALSWGIGSTEVEHVLATQTLWLRRPRQGRVAISGDIPSGVTAKDVALYAIRTLGADFGREHAVEFSGDTVAALSIAGRATLCNMAIELGARYTVIAPDEKAFEFLASRRFAPKSECWNEATAYWRTLYTDPASKFDKDVSISIAGIAPQITWGISLDHVIDIGGNQIAVFVEIEHALGNLV